jgi:hypothetical protein
MKLRYFRRSSVPEGTTENSPPFQRWDHDSSEFKSPVRDDRTMRSLEVEKMRSCHDFCRPKRDFSFAWYWLPTVETVGYSLPSLSGLRKLRKGATSKTISESHALSPSLTLRVTFRTNHEQREIRRTNHRKCHFGSHVEATAPSAIFAHRYTTVFLVCGCGKYLDAKISGTRFV